MIVRLIHSNFLVGCLIYHLLNFLFLKNAKLVQFERIMIDFLNF